MTYISTKSQTAAYYRRNIPSVNVRFPYDVYQFVDVKLEFCMLFPFYRVQRFSIIHFVDFCALSHIRLEQKSQCTTENNFLYQRTVIS
jgi:hypothetical protein